ncbi:branched-chain amino acid ABC transporter permease [Bradyrhizobium sp. Ce-3]|uniref:branched-chain amino acid ABC transporter permease n=1 Tax=Bradyrhizobium sp. Ce-3 TaxID=2913970 RepID=UPI001FC82520|nr:branched-chain amino acid ABC transporter permease [Bradyrhizobium sp. Ce-3]GKQ55185.1 branched-chain amino acid ABC transporter permease [Bradyrhizobium sp. Ce-3]
MQKRFEGAPDIKPWLAGAMVFAILAVAGALANPYLISLMTIVLLFTFLGQSWNLMLGIGGQLSIGHALFVALGAYSVAVLDVKYGISPWIGLLLGMFIAGCAGAVLAWLSFRFEVRGIYFALLTIAAAEFARIMFSGWEFVGAMQGLFFPAPTNAIEFAMLRGDARFYYFVALALAALGIVGTELISRSYLGYVWRAMRDDEQAARALGVRTFRHKILVIAISAATAAVGGGILALVQGSIFPDSIMGMGPSVDVLIGPVVGGLGTTFGPLVGSLAAIPLNHLMGALGDSLRIPGLNNIAYGIVLVLVVWFLPDGIWPAMVRLSKAIRPPSRVWLPQPRKAEE